MHSSDRKRGNVFIKLRPWLHRLRTLLLTAIALGLFLWLMAWLIRPNLSAHPPAYSQDEITTAENARDPHIDPTHPPILQVDEHITPAHESPLFDTLVEQQKLPPLKDRLPQDPIVMRGPDGIGNYGGTWMRLIAWPSDTETITYRLAGAYLVRWSPQGYPIKPHIAKSVEASPNKTIWTVSLRPGLRWSDGEPYTVNDMIYWWQHEANNPQVLPTPPAWMSIGGKYGNIEKIDDYHVRFVFDQPNGTFLEQLAAAREICDTPEHYLRQYNPDPNIGDAKIIARDQAAFKMASPAALYKYIKQTLNPEHPRLWPWVYRTYRTSTPQVFVRNPYYYVVDPAGNQLPYLDRIQFDQYDLKMLPIAAANGAATMQERSITFKDYTQLMSRSATGTDIHILHWYSAVRSMWVINPDLNRHIDPAKPDTKFKAQLLADKRFRQALSLAINRQAIIDAEYSGVGKPSQVAPGDDSPFANSQIANAFIQHDPARANSLLDAIGLTNRDSEGFRTFTDGTRMVFYLDFTQFTGVGPAQFVVDDWAAVGIRAVPRERMRPLFYAEKDARDFDFNVWTSESDIVPLISPRYFFAASMESFYAPAWGKWYMRGGLYGNKDATSPGCIPVPQSSPMYRSMLLFEAALRAPDLQSQKRYMDQVMSIASENVWSINITTAPPQLVVVKNDLKNVPAVAVAGNVFSTPSNTGIETYYFTDPHDSPGAISETTTALLQITPRPGSALAASQSATGSSIALPAMKWITFLGIAVLLILLSAKHPFVGRRLLIMVPTILLISVIVFIIINLPPGDFLTTKILQLEESGDASDVQSINDLRSMYHFDESHFQQYSRWMGFHWFVTFSPADQGLLQGNLGRSMETNLSINDAISDQLLLTVLLSLGTIIFTWCLALPIGIYSAVRQYSPSDHALTLIGFIGMCIPAFLLALVLTTLAGVSGLFSPLYAAQPEWSLGKVFDLLKHIWIPIVVLGLSGTAEMIRIMRANLLDELKKPYVTTALAKGVRPTKLILKYPVRLALNPFVSRIGGLFPQLISGGALVSIVLSLPTLGPLLIQALQNEDMYLAGSMLVILSLLGIIGTLVSDLLLLWLDPRIRFEGGSR